MKKVAVILSGCGYLDGSEIREAVGTLWAFSHLGAETECFAPAGPQADVVDHLAGKPAEGVGRDILIESARIARGKVKPLAELKPDQFDAIALPGGFGAAKNLCTFATQGSGATVLPEIKTILETAHGLRKPIAAVCISPAIVALVFKGKEIELTVGQPSEASQEIEKLGQKHVVCAANGCVVDSSYKVVTTPAYMYDDAPLRDIFTGIQKLARETLALSG